MARQTGSTSWGHRRGGVHTAAAGWGGLMLHGTHAARVCMLPALPVKGEMAGRCQI